MEHKAVSFKVQEDLYACFLLPTKKMALKYLGRFLQSPTQKLEQILRESGNVDQLVRFLNRYSSMGVNSVVFKGGFSALQMCSLHGHADCVRFLITQGGADCNHVNPLDNSTALHVGACGGSLAVVQALIELGGANVNCMTEVGFTPLHYAVLGGKRDVYVYMISTGLVDCSARNSEGISPLLLAARGGQLEAVAYLVEFAAISIQEADNLGCTALHYACANGNDALVTYLLSAGAYVASRDKKVCCLSKSTTHLKGIAFRSPPFYPLLFFLVQGRLPADLSEKAAIQAILASPPLSKAVSAATSSADVSSTNDSYRRYKVVDSIYAKMEVDCRSGNVRELEKIIKRRPDLIDMVFPGGWNCLHLCAQQGRASCIDALLTTTKMDADKGNEKNGITAMHIAAKFNHLFVIKLLMGKFKVNANHRTFKGRTPLHFAVLYADKTLCSFLLANKADHYAQDMRGVTALIAAALRGNGDIMALLIQYGADLGVQDVRGRTALHVAYAKGHLMLTAMLIKAGANEAVRNRRGETPLESMSGALPSPYLYPYPYP